MDRSRWQRNQSDEKQSTSLLIQQLAAQRERRLNATTASRPVSSHVDEAAAESLPGSSVNGDEVEESLATSAATSAAGRGKPGRNRLVRRDHAAGQRNNNELEDLTGMMQSIGLSNKQHTSSNTAPMRNPLRIEPPATSRSSNHAQSKQHKVMDLSNAEDSENAPSTTTALEQIEDSSSDDEPVACIPHSKKPAAAVALNAGRRPAAAAADASALSSEDEHERDSNAGHCRSAAAAFIDAEAAESSADDYDSSTADETEATESDVDADSSDIADSHRASSKHHCSSRPAVQQSSASSSAAGSTTAAAAAVAAEPAAGSLVLEGGFCLDVKIASKLYPHQVEGVKWLWSLHRMRKGGILADDMGLGKTMQCSAFLAGALQRSRHTFSSSGSSSADAITSGAIRALIIAPKTLLAHWEKELRVCGMGSRTHSFYGSSEGERCASLRAVTSRGGVMLTTYGMVLHNAQQLRAGLGQAARDIDEHEEEEDPFSLEPTSGRRILWDYIILDEGHKIKNARTQLAQRLRELRAITRVIISGTPVQNNLAELHSLLDFAVPGLLGGPREFKLAFEKPITAGQDRSAGLRVREIGAAKAAELRRIVGPFMLRREKKEVFGGGGSGTTSSGGAASGTTAGVVAAAGVGSTDSQAAAGSSHSRGAIAGAPAAPAPMGVKHDLVVWLRLQPLQRHIYEAFLHSDAVKAALNSSRSPLAALTVLKKVCDHPALLSERATKLVMTAASKQGKKSKDSSRQSSKAKGSKQRRDSLDDFIVEDSEDDSYRSGSEAESGSESDDNSSSGGGNAAAHSRAAVAASIDDGGYSEEFLSWAAAEGLEERLLDGIGKKGLDASCKALFVVDLLECLVAAGHRTLVFSQSRVMLDILQASVVAHGWSYCRIDGSMASTDARQAEVEKFQAVGSKIPVFLLTTQVGGLGLTLTAANRVVIVDPSWNPATDNQSVDRAYRIGQSRDVVVYRLVTCGTVEEKIYRKQVFKGGLSKAGMEEGVQLRYFTHQELHELFKWDPAALAQSETQQLLTQQHKPSSRDSNVAAHVSWLERHALCAGTSEHGLLFSHQDPEGKHLQLSQRDSTSNMQGGMSAAAAAAGRRGFGSYGSHAYGKRGDTGGVSSVPGSSSSSSSSRGGSMAVNAAAAAAAGPSAGELSDMLSSLNIANMKAAGVGGSSSGGSFSPAAAGNSSAAAAAAAQEQEQRKQRESLQVEVQHLQYQLNRVTTDLLTVGARLPDGGSKLKARQQELQEALDAAQLQLKEVNPQQQQQQQQQQASPNASTSPGVKPHALVDITNSAANSSEPENLHQHQHQQQPFAGVSPAAANNGMKPHASGSAKPHATGTHVSPGGYCGQQQWQQPQQLAAPPPSRPMQLQPWQQQQQQRWQQVCPPPPPPPQQQQQRLTRPPSQPPSAQPADVKQQQAGSSSALGCSSSKGAAGSSSSRSGCNSSTSPVTLTGVVTLDGRVPTVAELKQRKHVLKRALHEGDKLRALSKADGKKLPTEQQQQWAAMYQEYKEIKALLEQQVERDTHGADVQGVKQGSRHSKGHVDMVDLT